MSYEKPPISSISGAVLHGGLTKAIKIVCLTVISLVALFTTTNVNSAVKEYTDESGITHYSTDDRYYPTTEERRSETPEERAATLKLSTEISRRAEFGRKLETLFLDEGMDTTVKTEGQWSTELVIEYRLASRVFANKMINRPGFAPTLKKMGFRSIRFQTGIETRYGPSGGEYWRYDLEGIGP